MWWIRLRTIIGKVAEILGLVQFVKWYAKLIGLGEHVEFIAHHLRDAGPVIEYLLNPPPAIGVFFVAIGDGGDLARSQATPR